MSLIERWIAGKIPNPYEDAERHVQLTLDADEFKPADDRSLLDISAERVSGFLDHLRREEARLVGEIAAQTEMLRQTRISIEAFDGAAKVIEEGMKHG